MEWQSALAGGLGIAIVGLIGNIIIQLWQRGKTRAEAGAKIAEGADSVVESALSMYRETKTELASIKARVAELETENAELKRRVAEQGEMIRQLQAELEQYRAQEGCPD